MERILLFIFFLIFSSCSPNCKFIKAAEQEVTRQLKTIEDSYQNQDGLTNNAVRSVLFFEKLTNIESNAVKGDLSYYERYRDFRKDVKNWQRWIKENKCAIKYEHIETTLAEIRKSTSWMDN